MVVKSKGICRSADRTSRLLQRLGTRSVAAFTLVPALFCLAVLHFALVGMLGWVEDVHRPLTADSTLDDDWQFPPYGLRHGDEDAGVVEVLLVFWPAFAFLVALLRTGTLL